MSLFVHVLVRLSRPCPLPIRTVGPRPLRPLCRVTRAAHTIWALCVAARSFPRRPTCDHSEALIGRLHSPVRPFFKRRLVAVHRRFIRGFFALLRTLLHRPLHSRLHGVGLDGGAYRAHQADRLEATSFVHRCYRRSSPLHQNAFGALIARRTGYAPTTQRARNTEEDGTSNGFVRRLCLRCGLRPKRTPGHTQ